MGSFLKGYTDDWIEGILRQMSLIRLIWEGYRGRQSTGFDLDNCRKKFERCTRNRAAN